MDVSQSFRIAVIGQSAFSAEYLKQLVAKKYEIAGVFTIPDDDKTGREDILATTAKQLNLHVFKIKRWRVPPETQQAIPEILELYKSINADLNVLPFCNQFVPMEIIEAPKYKSINYHPSLLPRHRGAASINWTLIQGDKEAGLTIFWTDAGLDTGPILMKKSCFVQPLDTVDSLYRRFLFPEGIKALVESVALIRAGQAPRIEQPLEGATYDPILRNKEELTRIPFERDGFNIDELHNFIRGMDKVPGAWCKIRVKSDEKLNEFEKVRLFSSSIEPYEPDDATMIETLRLIEIEGLKRAAICHRDGLLIFLDNHDQLMTKEAVNVGKLQICSNGKTIQAKTFGSPEANKPALELSDDEKRLQSSIRDIWLSILPLDSISNGTDFFYSGAGSMDVTRLVEEVKELVGDTLELENEDVYMATQFDEFVQLVVRRSRGESATGSKCPDYQPTIVHANKMELKFPTGLFIDNQFCQSLSGETMDCINPADEEILCQVASASAKDVDRAVQAARRAFAPGSEWRQMNARDRGKLLARLADLMEQHKQELATLESLDSGAVYTLALKTHIGMSIDVFRYFAGWCDKIHGQTIPINNARPNSNLTLTRKEPMGICAIITPWNYPLMMVSWKSAACLAAGNTLILKPAQACPLTALKWAELVATAGFPPGVVNVITGRGSGGCGDAILQHRHISKIGFTGSTETGKYVMRQCASEHLKKCSLELGGKSPLIIFADCDLKKAVKFGLSSVFFNKGENCIAAGRLFVEDSIHDQFVELVVEETKKMTIDDPLKRSTSHGPQNHLKHLESLEKFCSQAKADGAKLVYGGQRLERKGYFFMPTIYTEVEDHMFIAKEESFGPIMLISRFANEDVEGVIRRANRTNYGLASGVMTNDISKALHVAERIDAGTCFINVYNKTDVAAPFGGFKDSGFGKDLGQEALNEYLRTKTITIEY